jgi:hypothetical protein
MSKEISEMDYWELMPVQCDTGCGNFVLSDGCPKALENNEALCSYCCECFSHDDDGTSHWIETITE